MRLGYACAYTPLLLIEAAGAEPIRVIPVTDAPEQAGRLIHDNMCPHVKRVLDRAMAPDLPELDGVVWVNSCDAMRRLADAWRQARPEDPLPGVARRMIGNSFNGPIERRVGRSQELARRNRVHGAINPCHWGSRQGAGARGLMQEGLGGVGVPVLNLEVDCVDSRAFAEGQMRTGLEAFVEMIESRPSPWS